MKNIITDRPTDVYFWLKATCKLCVLAMCMVLTVTKSNAQNVVFDNSGTFVGSNYLYTFPFFPTPLGPSTTLRLGYGYTPRADRMVAYGGGYRNSWHPTFIDAPWVKWQEQMFFNLSLGIGTPPTTYNPGKRYLANRHNWAGYYAIYGLRERQSATGVIDPETGQIGFLDNHLPKDAVISFAYPKPPNPNDPNADLIKSRLIFEKIERDTLFGGTDQNTELATITHHGNLGFRTANPEARIEIRGNEGQDAGIYKAISVKSDDPIPYENFVLMNGSATDNKARLWLNVDNAYPPQAFNLYSTGGFGFFTKPASGMTLTGGDNQIILTSETGDLMSIELQPSKFKISDGSNNYLETSNGTIKIDKLKTSPGSISYLTIDNNGYLANSATFPNPGTPWSYQGNSYSGFPNRLKFGTMSTGTEIEYWLGGNYAGYATGFGGNRHNYFYGAQAIGGDYDLGYQFTPSIQDNEVLNLMARNRTNYWTYDVFNNAVAPPSIFKCETLYDFNPNNNSYSNKQLFQVINTGHTYIGDFSQIGEKYFRSFVTIGEPVVDATHSGSIPEYSLSHRNLNGDFIFSFDIADGSLTWNNSTFGLNVQAHTFNWDGNIYPYLNSSYDLGTTANKWRDIFTDRNLSVGNKINIGVNSFIEPLNATQSNNGEMSFEGSINPDNRNTTFDLGKSSARWRNLHLSNEINFANGSYLNPNSGMVWKGNILPYTNSTSVSTGFTLGNSNFRWREIYCFNTTIQTSDRRLKTNINQLQSSLELLKKLNPVTYNWKDKSINTELHYGFIAQELKVLFPNSIVVGDADWDTLGVRYTELIPILTKGLQEQQNLIENQKVEIDNLKNLVLVTSPSGQFQNTERNNGLMNKLPLLFQNRPNPFGSSTLIDYFIPEGSTQAAITVSDILGKLLYSFVINSTGIGRVELKDKDIAQGNYFYTLVVDGKIIDTKTMQVVKN